MFIYLCVKKFSLDFILSIRKTSRRLSLIIPLHIRNTYAFLVYSKQNISLYLSILQGLEVTGAIKRHHNSKYGPVEFLESTSESGGVYDVDFIIFDIFF